MDAIADEVQARAASICDGISAEFAARIRAARKLPDGQAAVIALKQAKNAAIKFVRENAAMEIRGRQKQARVMFHRGKMRPVDKLSPSP